MKMKINYIIALLLGLFVSYQSYSQNFIQCFVEAGPAQIQFEANNPQMYSTQSLSPSQRVLAIHLHLVANSLYNYYPDTAGVQAALLKLNEAFERSGISFRYCKIDSIENYKYNDFSIDNEIEEVKTLYYKAGVINVFVVGEIRKTGIYSRIEGYTFFPGGDDIIVITKLDFTSNGLAHQMGHFFGLYNTYENGFGLEMIDGSNCNTAGDLICDTPADISVGMLGSYPASTLTDTSGNKYHHPFNNMMSGNRFSRCVFSIAQMNKMAYILENYRSYLK